METSSALPFTLLTGAQATLDRNTTGLDRANEDLFAILCLVDRETGFRTGAQERG